MMSINLDDETERYLVKILAQENTNSSELIERLLREYLESIQPKKNFLERLLSSDDLNTGMLCPKPSKAGTIYPRKRRGFSICESRFLLCVQDCGANAIPLKIYISNSYR